MYDVCVFVRIDDTRVDRCADGHAQRIARSTQHAADSMCCTVHGALYEVWNTSYEAWSTYESFYVVGGKYELYTHFPK